MKFRKKPKSVKSQIEQELDNIKKIAPFISEEERLIRLKALRKKLMLEMVKRDVPSQEEIKLNIYDIDLPNFSLS